MKILIIAPNIEQIHYRGIQAMLKKLLKSFKDLNFEVYLLSGHPFVSSDSSNKLSNKIQLLYLKHYLSKGLNNLLTLLNFKKRRFIILKSIMGSFFNGGRIIKIEKEEDFLDIPILNYVDYVVQIPFIYQLHYRYPFISNFFFKRIVKKYHFDCVLTDSPQNLTNLKNTTKIIQFVHDLIPLEFIEEPLNKNDILRFSNSLNNAVSFSDLILVNSQDTEKKIKEINKDANTEVIYCGSSFYEEEVNLKSPFSFILKKYGLEKNQFLLFISSIEKRKNVERLIQAYLSVMDIIKVPLVICGTAGHDFENLMKFYKTLDIKLRKNIIFTGYISELDKVSLLQNALALVFPSLYEGIGIPVLEAFSQGCPVITSRKGGLTEIGGDAVLYVNNPYNVNEIAEKIYELFSNSELQNSLRAKGLERFKEFTDSKFKERLLLGLKGIFNNI